MQTVSKCLLCVWEDVDFTANIVILFACHVSVMQEWLILQHMVECSSGSPLAACYFSCRTNIQFCQFVSTAITVAPKPDPSHVPQL